MREDRGMISSGCTTRWVAMSVKVSCGSGSDSTTTSPRRTLWGWKKP